MYLRKKQVKSKYQSGKRANFFGPRDRGFYYALMKT